MRVSARWIRLAVGVAVTLVCLWLALRQVHIDGLVSSIRGLQVLWLALALGALIGGYAARILRWWWMLHLGNSAVRMRSCVWPLIAGFAINNIVPFRAGDLLRIVGFQEHLNTPPARLVGSLLLERILDLTALLGFFLVGVFGLRAHGIPAVYLRTAVGAVVLGAAGWVMLLFRGDKIERLLLRLARSRILAARNWSARLEQHIQQLFVALNIVRTPRRVLQLFVLSIIVWTWEGVIFVAIAAGLHYQGAPVGPWFAMATGSLSTLIPSSPGYVGTFDFFTIAGLSAYGADPSVAAAIAFIAHAVLWIPLTAAGISYLLFAYRARLQSPFSAMIVQGEIERD